METPGSPKKLAGRYEVKEILGRGGMGLVYRAYDTVVRREVAVKTVSPEGRMCGGSWASSSPA